VKALLIAGVGVRRILRWRANVFFLFVLPMLVILLLGAAFGGDDTARLGIVGAGGTRASELRALLAEDTAVALVRFGDEQELLHAVERGRVDAGLVVPATIEGALDDGRTVTLRYLARPGTAAQQVRTTIDAAVARLGTGLRAASFLRTLGIEPAARRAALARAAATTTPGISVRERVAGGGGDAGRFGASASSQLLLFVFLNSLNAAVWLVEARRLGVERRLLATPTPVPVIVTGELLGRFAIALLQALIIVAGAALLFGVDWGDPAAAAAVIVSFSLVGAAAAALLGASAKTDAQCGALALLLGMSLAALGGSTVPLEVFPPGMLAVASLTPHKWGNDAFHELVDRGGTLADVLPEIGVLLAFAAILLVLATWRLHRAVTR
jgi:ABC-2 type transport system permease protein